MWTAFSLCRSPSRLPFRHAQTARLRSHHQVHSLWLRDPAERYPAHRLGDDALPQMRSGLHCARGKVESAWRNTAELTARKLSLRITFAPVWQFVESWEVLLKLMRYLGAPKGRSLTSRLTTSDGARDRGHSRHSISNNPRAANTMHEYRILILLH